VTLVGQAAFGYPGAVTKRLALGFGGLSLLFCGWACSVYDESLLSDTTGAGGGQGGQGGATTGTGGSGGTTMCANPGECPGDDTECRVRTCEAGVCGITNMPAGTALTDQVVGDCLEQTCDGMGESNATPLDTDIPEDNIVCTTDACNGGVASNAAKAIGATCNGTSHCNAASECVECVIDANCASMVCNMTTFTCAAASCGDGAQNGNETDLNCGGSCPPCATGDGCLIDADCESNLCTGTTCAESCTDGIANQDETDVDCGGFTCGPCAIGQDCIDDFDCANDNCSVAGVCSCTGTHLMISEVRTRGAGGGNDEFMEIYNPTDLAVTIDAAWTLEMRSHIAASYQVRWTGPAVAVSLPSHGHYLVTRSEGVAGGYTPPPAGDGALGPTGTTDASSVVLKQNGATVDAVCFYTTAAELSEFTGGTHICEGTPILRGVANIDTSIERLPGGALGNCSDTGNNANDWAVIAPSIPQNLTSATTP
jgi:hypothetical protein